MSYLLYIDTSNVHSTIILIHNRQVFDSRVNSEQANHAQWIHVQLEDLLGSNNLSWKDIAAVCVLNGPGSYTGLRISLSVAKGICYAREIPLILLNKLQVMHTIANVISKQTKLCIIKARENEYFTFPENAATESGFCILSHDEILQELKSRKAILLVEKSGFEDEFDDKLMIELSQTAISELCFDEFLAENYADLFNSEPFYLKNFHFNKINKL